MTDPSIQATPPPPEAPPPPEHSLILPEANPIQAVLRFTLIFAIIHIVLWCICIGLLLLYVPPALKLFRDVNLQLPARTLFVVSLARLTEDYFTLLPLLLGFWLLFEVPLLGILRHRSRGAGWAWGLLHVLLPLLFAALIVYAIEGPKARLLEGLNR